MKKDIVYQIIDRNVKIKGLLKTARKTIKSQKREMDGLLDLIKSVEELLDQYG